MARETPHSPTNKWNISLKQIWEIDTSEGKVYFRLSPSHESNQGRGRYVTEFDPIFISNRKGFNRLHLTREMNHASFEVFRNHLGWWMKIKHWGEDRIYPEFRLTPVENLPEGIVDESTLDIDSDEE